MQGRLIQQDITICRLVPTIFRHFMSTLTREEAFPKLRVIYLAAEPVPHRVYSVPAPFLSKLYLDQRAGLDGDLGISLVFYGQGDPNNYQYGTGRLPCP